MQWGEQLFIVAIQCAVEAVKYTLNWSLHWKKDKKLKYGISIRPKLTPDLSAHTAILMYTRAFNNGHTAYSTQHSHSLHIHWQHRWYLLAICTKDNLVSTLLIYGYRTVLSSSNAMPLPWCCCHKLKRIRIYNSQRQRQREQTIKICM